MVCPEKRGCPRHRAIAPSRKGSQLDSALKAFQLVCITGFASRYIHSCDWISFDKELTERHDDGDAIRVKEYRERYLDCEGDIGYLCASVAEDISKIWGNPEPKQRIVRSMVHCAAPLGIVSQAETARICGDPKTERKLKRKLRFR